MEEDVAEAATPDEPTTPRAAAPPDASTDDLSISVFLTSELEEIDESIFTEHDPDVPEHTTETAESLVSRERRNLVGTAGKEAGKMNRTERRVLNLPPNGWQRIIFADALEESTRTPLQS